MPGMPTPGAKIFFAEEQRVLYVSTEDTIVLSKDCTLEKACVLCLGIYYVKNMSYPSSFGMTLALFQLALMRDDPFPKAQMSQTFKRAAMALKLIV